MGINQMSDWSTEEYYKTLGLVPEDKYPIEIVEGELEDEDCDDQWKDCLGLENDEWSNISPKIDTAQQSLIKIPNPFKGKGNKNNNKGNKVGGMLD